MAERLEKQISNMSNYEPSKNKDTKSRYLTIKVMDHTPIKNLFSTMKSTNYSSQLIIGSYQADINPHGRKLT